MTPYKRCRNSSHVSTCSLENDVSVRAVDSHSKHIGSHDPNDESLVPLVFRCLELIVTL
jgi:hypothetical protein